MDLSVVVPSFNSAESLEACLTTLTSELKRIGVTSEIIAVDNGSTDGTFNIVSAKFPAVKVIRNPVNEYFVRAVNQGYSESSGRFVLIVGSDVEVVPGAVNRLLEFMNSFPQVAAASCRIVTPSNGKLQPTGGHFLSLTSDLFEWTRFGWLFPHVKQQIRDFHYMQLWDRSDNREVDCIVANFMIFRREAVEGVRGLFDNRFLMFFAEDELCWRLKRGGWKVYHLGDVFVYHKGRLTLSKLNSKFLSELSLRDRLEYHKAVLGSTRAFIFRIVLHVDSFFTNVLKISGIIE